MNVLGLPVSRCVKHPSLSGFKKGEAFIEMRPIGEGNFSKVYEVQRLFDSTVYALKVAEERRHFSYIKTEHKILSYLNEKEESEGVNHCVRALAIFDLVSKMALLEPLYQRDLEALVEAEKGLSMKRTLEIMVCFFDVLSFLKKHGVIHRDIKPENVFITERGEIKLGDFGLAILKEETLEICKAGTPDFISPEYYIEDNLCDYASDMWSAAVLFCFVYLGDRRMFEDVKFNNIFLNHQIRMRQPYSENLVKHMTSNHKESILWKFEETSQLTFEDVMQSFFDSKKEAKALDSSVDETKDQVEFNEFLSFLKELFEFDPDKRATPEKALSEFERVFGSKQKFS